MTNNVIGSREEQDVIKAIEESLKENQNVPGFSPFAQKDAENPHERKRIDLMPVGLKNIGNSCWFNVIAQVLFILEAIYRFFLSYIYIYIYTDRKYFSIRFRRYFTFHVFGSYFSNLLLKNFGMKVMDLLSGLLLQKRFLYRI